MIRKSLLALAALTLAGAAQASLYTVTGSFDADPGTEVLTGTLDFSDAEVAAGGADGAFALTALSFSFLGESFTLAGAFDPYVQFEGGTLTGPNASFTTSAGDTLALQSFFGVAGFTFSGANGDRLGTLSLAPAATALPEPASLALALGGLGAAALGARRRKV